MKIHDENKSILHCKKAFSCVLEDIASKLCRWGKPQTPILKHNNYGKNS